MLWLARMRLKSPYRPKQKLAIASLAASRKRQAVDLLLEALNNKDHETRRDAVVVLQQKRDPRTVEPLIELIHREDYGSVRLAAYEAVCAIGNEDQKREATRINETRRAEAQRQEEERLRRQAEFEERERLEKEELKQIVATLNELCKAYAANDREVISRLEPEARHIGLKLFNSGGIRKMRQVFSNVPSGQGKRTLDMLWDGIGGWGG